MKKFQHKEKSGVCLLEVRTNSGVSIKILLIYECGEWKTPLKRIFIFPGIIPEKGFFNIWIKDNFALETKGKFYRTY